MSHHSSLASHVDRFESLMFKARENRWQIRVVLDGVVTFAAHRLVVIPVRDDTSELTVQTLKLSFEEHEQGIRSMFMEGPRSRLLMVSTIDQNNTIQDCWVSQVWAKGVNVEDMTKYPGTTRMSFILLLCPPKE